MKISRIFPLLLVAFATACSDDEPLVIIEDTDVANVHEVSATYNSLSFAWDKVDGVNQYGYSLIGADGLTVVDGITDATNVTITDLDDDTTFDFELRVYGAYGATSYRTSIKASTLPIVQLGEPKAKSEQVGNKMKISWEPVENAAAYEYSYSIGENKIVVETTDTECTIVGLAPGSHEITVRALSDYAGYTDSEISKIIVQRTRKEIATVDGTYTSGLIRRNNSWACTMHIYDDNSYVIDGFYQGEGYNLDIYVDTDAEEGADFVGIYNFVEFPDLEYYVMETGRASVPQIDMIPGYADGEYGSTFTGDATAGTITINTRFSTTTGTDKFVW